MLCHVPLDWEASEPTWSGIAVGIAASRRVQVHWRVLHCGDPMDEGECDGGQWRLTQGHRGLLLCCHCLESRNTLHLPRHQLNVSITPIPHVWNQTRT